MQKHLLLYLLIVTAAIPVVAQSNSKNKNSNSSAENGKRPEKLRSSWGLFLTDTLPKSEIVKLLNESLTVRDEKNNKYPVISFAFTYEKQEPYLNDTTGQLAIFKDYTGDNFKAAFLPALWSNRLKETLQTGDVLYFDEIIIQYPGNKLYRAPALKITVQ